MLVCTGCMHLFVSTHVHTYVSVYVCMRSQVCVHVLLCTMCLCIRVCVHVLVFACVCVCVHVHASLCTSVCVCVLVRVPSWVYKVGQEEEERGSRWMFGFLQ